MNFQYIFDSKGNTTGVYIPIADWNKLKQNFKNIDMIERENFEDQKEEVKKRYKNYVKNPGRVMDFDDTLDDIEKDL